MQQAGREPALPRPRLHSNRSERPVIKFHPGSLPQMALRLLARQQLLRCSTSYIPVVVPRTIGPPRSLYLADSGVLRAGW